MVKKTGLFVFKWVMIFFVISIIAFLIPRVIPENPVEGLLETCQMEITEENVEKIEEAWGLNKSLPEQYAIWIGNFMKGNWGKSLVTKADIKEAFKKKLPYSLTIGLGGILLSAVLAFFLGLGAARREHGVCDWITRIISVFSMSVPSFAVTSVIVYFIGVKLGIVKFFTSTSIWSMVIAVLLMALYSMGATARVIKTHFREQMASSYVTFAISRGFSMDYVLLRHTYKPVLSGLISILISQIPSVFAGSSILEFSLGIPGISYFLIQSMRSVDYYVLQSYIMVVIIWVFLFHLIFDIILNFLDVKRRKVQ